MTTIPTQSDVDRLLAQWREWLGTRTDALLSLEDRVRSAGTAADIADVAAAFVARKAISDRLDEVTHAARRDRAGAVSLSKKPLADDLGGVVGRDLTDAATLLDAIVERVEQRVAAHEQREVAHAAAAQQADADLAIAGRLAAELGMQVNHVASLRDRLHARLDVAAVADDATTVRASLEAAARERSGLLAQWAAAPSTLAELAAIEARVRELADRCRAKVRQVPMLAIPSVSMIEAQVGQLSGEELAQQPWVGVRARVAPILTKIERLAAALAEAERRFQQPLQQRDELRGLLQAFADKASAGGVMETPELDGLYQQAKAVLWAAPCDVEQGSALAGQYVAAVNATLKGVAR
jgi:hypothetical protein